MTWAMATGDFGRYIIAIPPRNVSVDTHTLTWQDYTRSCTYVTDRIQGTTSECEVRKYETDVRAMPVF